MKLLSKLYRWLMRNQGLDYKLKDIADQYRVVESHLIKDGFFLACIVMRERDDGAVDVDVGIKDYTGHNRDPQEFYAND